LHPRKIELGLERVHAVLDRMQLRRPGFRVLTVAGTNGKGSTVALLEATLRAAGYRVGAYTSPHLIRYNERVRLDGQEATDESLCAAFERIEAARGEVPLTYFEFGTLAALDQFARGGVDVAVLEVGMGGRLDAVNAVDADAAVVTSIGIDHVQWLGNTRAAIGREKAGVFRRDRPAVCADPDPPASIAEVARAVGARLYQRDRDFFVERTDSAWGWRHAQTVRAGLPWPTLRGDCQLDNAAGALMLLDTVADILPVSQAHLRQGLVTAAPAGRFQVLPGLPVRVFDVAHNPDAVRRLAQTLAQQPVAGRTHAVFGMLRDKDIAGAAHAMRERVDAWYVTALGASERGASADEVAAALAAAGVTEPVARFPDARAAYVAARRAAAPVDRLVVFGSFYMVGDILSLPSSAL